MKRILINATQEEELRVAIVDGQKLIDLDIETSSAKRKKSNIYKGVISRIEPGLDAVFVDYGNEKHGFLPFREISQAYFKNKTSGGRNNSAAIARALNPKQPLLVQVQREGHGGKGAALTTFISLAGRYLVLMPNNPRAGGVSRRMDDKERDATRQVLSQLNVNDEEGVIIRTKGAGREIELLRRDLDYLRSLWTSIITAAKGRPAPFLVYEESNIVICALRDHFSDDTEEVMVDNQKVFDDSADFIKLMMPQHLSKLKLYQEPVPLFNRYHIEGQIETAFDREITLPSGGSVVFDRTEALLSIDINSGKATRGSNIEETALNTNLEAADEIARQLRLRDLGGLIVIDFIDMFSIDNRKAVENRLHQMMRQDQARVQLERISRFGLLEMSRQRLRPSLSESSQMVCTRCSGKGSIRTLESSALATLRMMEEEAMKEKSGRVVAQLPIEITSFLLNEKRDKINEIESRHGVELMIVPDPQMQIPHFQIRRYRADDEENRGKYSYEMMTERKTALSHSYKRTNDGAHEKPAVGPAMEFMDPRKASHGQKNGLIAMFSSLFQKKEPGEKPQSETTQSEQPQSERRSEASGESGENNRRRRRRGGRRRGGRSQERRQSETSRQQDNRMQAPHGGRDEKPAATETAASGSQRRGSSGHFRRSRPPPKRQPPVSATTTPSTNQPDGNRFGEQQRGDRAMTPPPYATDRQGTQTGVRTVFTPPMPTLPTNPPAQTANASGDTHRAADDTVSKPASAPTTPDRAPAPAPVSESAPKPASGADSGEQQDRPAAYSPPRFSKPANLTQVETKNTPAD